MIIIFMALSTMAKALSLILNPILSLNFHSIFMSGWKLVTPFTIHTYISIVQLASFVIHLNQVCLHHTIEIVWHILHICSHYCRRRQMHRECILRIVYMNSKFNGQGWSSQGQGHPQLRNAIDWAKKTF